MDNSTEEITRHPPEKRRGGEWVTFGLDAYRVPPLAFSDMEDLADEIATLGSIGAAGAMPGREQIGVLGKVLHAALARNYPSIDPAEVKEMLDMGNFHTALAAVLGMSGFQQVEGGQPGEAPASIGPASTPA